MKLDFIKNTRRNMVAASINKMLGLVFPFLNRTFFLWLMGAEYLGLNSLFTSILGVLSLADLGFGTAVVCSMYKPVADDDRELLCAYLKLFRFVYRCVGAVILVCGLCLLPFLRKLVHGDVPADVSLHVLYVIHLLNTTASYFLFAYRGVVLYAYHRDDVMTNIRTLTTIAQYLVVFAILFFTRNYYHYVIAMVGFTVLNNLLTVREARRLFPDISPHGQLAPERRRLLFGDVKAIFMHRFGGVIFNSFANVFISAFLGLVAVAAYGNYYDVVASVTGLIWALYNSMTSGFGNKIHTETRETNFALFMKANRLVGIVIAWSAALMAALYQPFIRLWTHGDPALVRHALTPTLMVLFFYVNQSRRVLLTYKAAASLWRADRWKPITAGVANIALNFLFMAILPDIYKLDGVILSVILTHAVIEMPWEAHVMFTAYFTREQGRMYWRGQLRFAALALVLCAVAWRTAKLVQIDNLMGLAKAGTVAALVSGGLVLACYWRDAQTVFRRLAGR